eukprot:3888850-Pyramimonas_sp.AAC.1
MNVCTSRPVPPFGFSCSRSAQPLYAPPCQAIWDQMFADRFRDQYKKMKNRKPAATVATGHRLPGEQQRKRWIGNP